MKNVIMIYLTLLFVVPVLAQESCDEETTGTQVTGQKEINTDVPNFLKGATIIVKLKDGTETKVPAEKFKVVPRKQQFLVTATETSTLKTCTKNVSSPRHRVSLHVGKGPLGGLDRKNPSVKDVTVESQYGGMGALQYQYRLYKDLSISGQVQSNDSGMIGAGLDF